MQDYVIAIMSPLYKRIGWSAQLDEDNIHAAYDIFIKFKNYVLFIICMITVIVDHNFMVFLKKNFLCK